MKGLGLSLLAMVLVTGGLCATPRPQDSPVAPWAQPPFIENLGQWPEQDSFVAFCGATAVRLQRDGVVVQLHDDRSEGAGDMVVRLAFEGRQTTIQYEAIDELPGSHNFLMGSDRSAWRTGAKGFAEVVARDVYPGVDLRLRAGGDRIEFDFVVRPGADVSAVQVRVDGARGLETRADGSLRLDSAHSGLALSRPVGSSLTGLHLIDSTHFGLHLGEASDGEAPSVVGSGLEWGTFLGGSFGENGLAVDVDSAGSVVVAGDTVSSDFPVTPGAFDETYQSSGGMFSLKFSIFIAVLQADGASLVYATYLGGKNHDRTRDVGFGLDGSVYVCGRTSSVGFPVTDGSVFAVGDGFLTRIDPTGSALISSTFVGGNAPDEVTALAVHQNGEVTVLGWTMSPDFPVSTPGFITTGPAINASDVFLGRMDASGTQFLWSTLYGGSFVDLNGGAMAVDTNGNVAFTGLTSGVDLPLTPNAWVTSDHPDFVAVIGDSGETLVYSSYYGWSGLDGAGNVAFDPLGRLVLTGGGTSPDYPVTAGVFQPEPAGLVDGHLTCIDLSDGSIVFATFFGGGAIDAPSELSVDASGLITVAGVTDSLNFPITPGAFQITKTPFTREAFVARISPKADRLLYSSFLGGSAEDVKSGMDLHVGATGSATIVGDTKSLDFPVTPGAFDPTQNGSTDAFIVRMSLLPQGVVKFGASTPGCRGPLAAGVLSMPVVGSTRFGLTCTAAPSRSTSGFLVLSSTALSAPVMAAGAGLWLDPSQLRIYPGIVADELGWSVIPATLPNDPSLVGVSLAAQFLWPDSCAAGGISASNALVVTIEAPL